jgi:sugar phosphate isomerase/epimerase
VVRTASALNAPVLRIWAGAVGSEAATPAHRRAIVESARMVGELAQEAGIEVAFEFHGNTLNDSARACRQLLEEIDHPNVGTYWQPLGVSDVAGRLTELDMILDRLSNVHAYQLDEDRRRLPLAEGGEAWTACLRRLVHTGRDHAVMLEFVRGDDPEAFRADAHTLQGWVNDLQSP